MNRLASALDRLRTDLAAIHADWALVGGLALAVRAEPRTTRDVDVAVSVSSDAEAEQIIRKLARRGYKFQGDVLEHETRGRLAAVRLLAPTEPPELVVDLLFASSGIEPEIVAGADLLELFPSLPVPVARVGHLLALKILAGRRQDLADAGTLLADASAADIDLARRSLELIERRGFDRKRGSELLATLEEILAERPTSYEG